MGTCTPVHFLGKPAFWLTSSRVSSAFLCTRAQLERLNCIRSIDDCKGGGRSLTCRAFPAVPSKSAISGIGRTALVSKDDVTPMAFAFSFRLRQCYLSNVKKNDTNRILKIFIHCRRNFEFIVPSVSTTGHFLCPCN